MFHSGLDQDHPGSYNTPLTSSAQESYVQDCSVDVNVSCRELCVPVASGSSRQHACYKSSEPEPRSAGFAIAELSLWNSLPAAVRRKESTLHTFFTGQLKAYLFYI